MTEAGLIGWSVAGGLAVGSLVTSFFWSLNRMIENDGKPTIVDSKNKEAGVVSKTLQQKTLLGASNAITSLRVYSEVPTYVSHLDKPNHRIYIGDCYEYRGRLGIELKNVEQLLNITPPSTLKKYYYQGDDFVALWCCEDGWFVFKTGENFSPLIFIVEMSHRLSVSFHTSLITEHEYEFSLLLDKFVYGDMSSDEIRSKDCDVKSIAIYQLKESACADHEHYNSQYAINLTKAPTSVIIRLAEQVTDKTIHDRYVKEIRDELAKRLETLKNIEETKRILYS